MYVTESLCCAPETLMQTWDGLYSASTHKVSKHSVNTTDGSSLRPLVFVPNIT